MQMQLVLARWAFNTEISVYRDIIIGDIIGERWRKGVRKWWEKEYYIIVYYMKVQNENLRPQIFIRDSFHVKSIPLKNFF